MAANISSNEAPESQPKHAVHAVFQRRTPRILVERLQRFGVYSTIGRRKTQEDAHQTIPYFDWSQHQAECSPLQSPQHRELRRLSVQRMLSSPPPSLSLSRRKVALAKALPQQDRKQSEEVDANIAGTVKSSSNRITSRSSSNSSSSSDSSSPRQATRSPRSHRRCGSEASWSRGRETSSKSDYQSAGATRSRQGNTKGSELADIGEGEEQEEEEEAGDEESMEKWSVSKEAQQCTGFFGVFDGHGGRRCSDLISQWIPETLFTRPCFGQDIHADLRESFAQVEERFIRLAKEEDIGGGSTAVVGLFVGSKLYVANVGDSEALMSVDGVAVPVSRPHNMLQNPDEEARVRAVGARVHRKRLGHPVYNPQFFSIGVTRAIGDLMYKDPEICKGKPSGLIAEPEIRELELTTAHEFLILACDGLWAVVPHQTAVNFVLMGAVQLKTKHPDRLVDWRALAKGLVQYALSRGSTDNVTVLIVSLSSDEAIARQTRKKMMAAAQRGGNKPAGSHDGMAAADGSSSSSNNNNNNNSCDAVTATQEKSASPLDNTPPKAKGRGSKKYGTL